MPKNYRKRSHSRSRSRSRQHNRHRNRDHRAYHKRGYSRSDSESRSSQSSQAQPKFKVEETKCLRIEKCGSVQQASRILTEASINAGTSVPDEVQERDGDVYSHYPSIEVAVSVLKHLNEIIEVSGRKHSINFHPFHKIDLNVSYDWYCEHCDYKNFARRNKCYQCESEKNENCKLIYASQPAQPAKDREDNINTCSLMVRGPVITRISEEALLAIFEDYAPIRDIRMISNRVTGRNKDFAFIEFYSSEEAAIALKKSTSSDFRIQGEKAAVMYSRNKSEDDYAKPLPYERRERRHRKEKKGSEEPVESYYKRQRKLEIELEKQRPVITMDQLREKKEQQLRSKAPLAKEMTAEQNQRRQAELMARQWEKEVKLQNTLLYICVLCRRKFKDEAQMRAHESGSQLHQFNLQNSLNL